MRLADKYVLVLNECGSMTEAARKIGISQPSLSMSIANLERKLGYQIFNRKSNPITTTKVGALYVDYLRQLDRLDQDYEKMITDIMMPNVCTITIGGPSAYVSSILMEAAALFHEKEPECVITIKEMSLQRLVEETETGDMDCFISTTDSLPEHLVVEKLKEESIYLCIPKSWEINEKLNDIPGEKHSSSEKEDIGIDYQKLDGLPVISMLPDMPMQAAVNQFCEEQQIKLRTAMMVDQTLVGLKLAAKGIGLFFASEEALRSEELLEKLQIYSLPKGRSDRQLYIAQNGNRYRSHVNEKFVQLLKEMTK